MLAVCSQLPGDLLRLALSVGCSGDSKQDSCCKVHLQQATLLNAGRWSVPRRVKGRSQGKDEGGRSKGADAGARHRLRTPNCAE
jgi:hypothetical protein